MVRRLGIAAHVLAIACIVFALIKRDDGTVVFGALDRSDSGLAIIHPNIVPWLVAAMVLVALGTVLLLRRES